MTDLIKRLLMVPAVATMAFFFVASATGFGVLLLIISALKRMYP